MPVPGILDVSLATPSHTAVPPLSLLQAPDSWRTVDFISDLHLQPSEPATVQAWQGYLQRSRADAICLLGDLFEVWVGDDSLAEPGSFEAECAAVLHAAARQRPLFFMVGNRDFLAGPGLMAAAGMTALADPTVLALGRQRVLLSHGDALCLDDVDYQRFRAMARSPAWQQQVLAQPLARRRALGQSMRSESEQRKQSDMVYADLDTPATLAWMDAAQATLMVHGHTHQPADHALPGGRTRIVLSDWHLDADGTPPRAEVLRLERADAQGAPLRWTRIAPEAA